MRERAMEHDFSWEKSAKKYVKLYEEAMKKL
jgi:glycogen synthase